MAEIGDNVEQPRIEELIRVAELLAMTGGDSEAAFDAHASLVDVADDEENEAALVKAIELAEGIEAKCLPKDACLIHYNRSNAWAALHRIRSTPENVWSWEQPELLEQVYWLRAAIQHEGYAQLPRARRGQLHCNLGNALSSAGRFVDALAEWRQALNEQPILGMARGNLGKGLIRYGMALYDEGHTYWFLRFGQLELSKAVAGGIGRDGATYQEAIAHFSGCLADVEHLLTAYDGTPDDILPTYSMGKSKGEQQYRQWCLERHLFLNPLNDLGAESVAAQDVLSLPTHCANKAGITFLAFFNQLKQEYSYARWCLYEGTKAQRVHLADRSTMLAFTCDYAHYSMALEQIKTAFRCTYSLLDKVAYFINAYWQLEIPETSVYFRSLWYDTSKGKVRQVRQAFETSENLPLRGLFWLSKDIYSNLLREVAHPNAKDLYCLRNHLEHKHVKVVDSLGLMINQSDIWNDRLAYKVERDEFQAKTEHLLLLSRSALIYLCLAMHSNEQRTQDSGDITLPLEVGIYPTDFKV